MRRANWFCSSAMESINDIRSRAITYKQPVNTSMSQSQLITMLVERVEDLSNKLDELLAHSRSRHVPGYSMPRSGARVHKKPSNTFLPDY